jgi:hypothetical protein
MKVMTPIGIRLAGSFQPMRTAAGASTRNDMRIPLKAGFRVRFDDAIRNPDTTYKENADKLASQLKP